MGWDLLEFEWSWDEQECDLILACTKIHENPLISTLVSEICDPQLLQPHLPSAQQSFTSGYIWYQQLWQFYPPNLMTASCPLLPAGM